MSFFDQFVQEQAEHRPYQLCTVAKVRRELNEEDRSDFDRVLGDPSFTGATIARRLNKALGDKAHGIKSNTVMRHRNHNCSCDR